MPDVGTTLTDLTNVENVAQARFELDRAMQSSGYAHLSSWAVKWGRVALDALDDLPDIITAKADVEEARADRDALDAALDEANSEKADLEDDYGTLARAVERAIKELNQSGNERLADELRRALA